MRLRLESDAEPFDAGRIAGCIEPHSCNADARVVPLRDQPREQVEFTIRAANGGGIQHAFDLLGIAWLRLHDDSQAPQLKFTHTTPHGRGSVKHAMIASVTGFVSLGPRTA